MINPFVGQPLPPGPTAAKAAAAVTPKPDNLDMGGFVMGLAKSFLGPLLGGLFDEKPKPPPPPPPPPVQYMGMQRGQSSLPGLAPSSQAADTGSRMQSQDPNVSNDAMAEFKRRLAANNTTGAA